MMATHSMYLIPVRPASILISTLLLLRIVVCALSEKSPVLAEALVLGLEPHIDHFFVDDCVVHSVYRLFCFCVGFVCQKGIALILYCVDA